MRWFRIESERGLGSGSEDRRVSQNREDLEGKGEFIREMEGWESFRFISVSKGRDFTFNTGRGPDFERVRVE